MSYNITAVCQKEINQWKKPVREGEVINFRRTPQLGEVKFFKKTRFKFFLRCGAYCSTCVAVKIMNRLRVKETLRCYRR